MAWVSPTGENDPDNAWSFESQIRDDNLLAHTRNDTHDHYLEVSITPSILCDKVRIYQYIADTDTWEVDVHYGAAWHNIYSGGLPTQDWLEINIGSTQTVDQARMRNITSDGHWLTEFDFNLAITVHEKEITEGIAVAEVLIKNPIKNISEGVALGEVLQKVITKAPFIEGIAVGEVVTAVRIQIREIIEGIAIGEAVTKMVSKVISEGIAIGEVLIKMRVIAAIRSLRAARVLDALRNLVSERTRPPE